MVTKRKGRWYVYFRPFKDKKIGLRLDTESTLEARAMEVMILKACRSGNYSGLDSATREACVRMFVNQRWELPPELGGMPAAIQKPKEELTLWKAAELMLKYPSIKNSPNRARHEFALVHVLEHFGKDYPVKRLWIPQVKEYQLERENQGAAASTINKEKAALSALFQVLIELRHVHENPARLTKPLSERESKREVYLSLYDFQRIADVVPSWFRPIAETAFYTGMRKGEILGLTRDRLKLDRRLFLLGAGDVKERTRKRVPVHRDLVPILVCNVSENGNWDGINLVESLGR
jgi:hypothetical protein